MINSADATSKWCPFALTQSPVQERFFGGGWRDTRITGTVANYSTFGISIAVTVINRTASGDAHPDCLCITNSCVWWRQLGADRGDCSKFNDNMQSPGSDDDSAMKDQWCPLARPQDAPVTVPWVGTISGATIAIASPNRVAGNSPHPSSKCITKNCMAFVGAGADKGYCMAADKNMQR